MANYHKHGGLKKGTALVLTMCFLMGSGITALAAGDGVADAYEGLVEKTSVKSEAGEFNSADADDEALEELMRAFDLDSEDVVMMDDDIEPYASIKQIWWTVPPGKTYMSTYGMSQDVGDELSVTVWSTPFHEDYTGDITYQMGIKDPECIMRYVEGTGELYHDFYVDIKGTYYFFVTNMDENEPLDVEAVIVRRTAMTTD